MSDLIDRQKALDAVSCIGDENSITTIGRFMRILRALPSEEPETTKCRDCKNWIPGYITDNDDFIPPKCGRYQQMVGHSSNDYCSLAERRTDEQNS